MKFGVRNSEFGIAQDERSLAGSPCGKSLPPLGKAFRVSKKSLLLLGKSGDFGINRRKK